MFGLLKSISRIGISEGLSQAKRLQIELCNILCMLSFLICLFYFIVFLFTDSSVQSFIYLIGVTVSLIALFLNFKNKNTSAIVITITLATSLVFYTVVYAGFESQAHCLLTTLVLCSFIMFRNLKYSIICTVLICLLFIGSYYYVNTYGAINPESRLHFGEYFNYIFAIVASALLSFIVIREVEDYITKLESSLDLNEKRNEELETMNMKIENQNKNLELFTSVASHDLRTPLRNVSGFIGLINRRLNGQDPKVDEYINYTQKGVKQMEELINSITYLNRINHDDLEETKSIDLNELCINMLQDLNIQFFPGLSVRYHNLHSLTGKESHFYNLFRNFIENAWKYNQNEERIVEISTQIQDDKLVLSFRDNGIGFDAMYKDQIFNAFERLHANDEYEGTGMGLFICKKIVNLYNGNIEVESVPGEGTTFRMRFPKSIIASKKEQRDLVASL